MPLSQSLLRAWARVRSFLPELNFITIHYAFFIIVSLLASLIFWGSSTPSKSIGYTDALFLCVSAITEAGLNTVNLSTLNTWQQIMLFVLILIGSPIFVSCAIVYVRIKAFERAFVELKQDRRARRQRSLSFRLTNRLVHSARPSEDGGSRHTEEEPGGNQIAHDDQNSEKKNDTNDLGDSSADSDRDRSTRISDERERDQERSSVLVSSEYEQENQAERSGQQIEFAQGTRFSRPQHKVEASARPRHPLFSFQGVGARSTSSLRRRQTSNSIDEHRPPLSRASSIQRYDQRLAETITEQGWISRNSQFHGLSLEERQKLGGIEYRAVLLLSFLVPGYLIVWQGLGVISLGAYVHTYYAETARGNGQIPFWVGAFNAVSAFGNNGMSLVDANMIAFQKSGFMLVSMSLFILAGNTAYPIFLRSLIWIIWKLLPDSEIWAEDKQTCRFLLDHPRRVYTNMFPSKHTWWLALSLFILNGLDWMFFEVLSINDQAIDSLPPVTRVLGGLFQAFAVRSGGFYVVAIPTLRLSLQFLYVIMMYISVYPVTISIRNSNVYEERSLGIFAEDIDHDAKDATSETPLKDSRGDLNGRAGVPGNSGRMARLAHGLVGLVPAPKREKRSYFMRQQLRAQLAHDAWFSVVAIFLILIIENGQLEADPVNFSVFDVVFEVVSAYATVGLSIGLPYAAFSFSGSWHKLSKLILCAVMLRGRHMGLPVAIDHAIQLPTQRTWAAEDEDGERRMETLQRNRSSPRPLDI